MNIKASDNRPVKKLVKGHDVLSVAQGTLIRYERHEGGRIPCGNRPGQLMMRTNRDDNPLVCLKTGQLWGTRIENDVFEILENTEVNIDIN